MGNFLLKGVERCRRRDDVLVAGDFLDFFICRLTQFQSLAKNHQVSAVGANRKITRAWLGILCADGECTVHFVPAVDTLPERHFVTSANGDHQNTHAKAA